MLTAPDRRAPLPSHHPPAPGWPEAALPAGEPRRSTASMAAARSTAAAAGASCRCPATDAPAQALPLLTPTKSFT